MIKGLKKCVLVTAALAMTAVGVSGCGKNIDGTAVAAVCNEEKIPMGVASLYTRYQQAQMYNYYNSYFGGAGGGGMFDTVSDEKTGTTYGDTLKEDMLTMLEDLYLLRQNADEYKVELTDEEKTAITDTAKSFVEANDAETLKKIGASQSDVETLLELYTYQNKMREAMIADVDTNVTDEEAAQSKVTYVEISLQGTEKDEEGNAIDLTEEEKAQKQAAAQQILDQINASGDTAAADMDAIAKGVDEKLSAATRTFGSDDENLDTIIKDTAAGLTDGQMAGGVLTSEDGTKLYVVRLDAAFDQASTDSKKESIVSEREQKDYDDEVKGWEEKAKFDVKKGQWKKISINDKDVYTYKAQETEETETTETPAEDAAETPTE